MMKMMMTAVMMMTAENVASPSSERLKILEEEIVKHSVVILTASSLDEQMRINEITHKAGILGISNLI